MKNYTFTVGETVYQIMAESLTAALNELKKRLALA